MKNNASHPRHDRGQGSPKPRRQRTPATPTVKEVRRLKREVDQIWEALFCLPEALRNTCLRFEAVESRVADLARRLGGSEGEPRIRPRRWR